MPGRERVFVLAAVVVQACAPAPTPLAAAGPQGPAIATAADPRAELATKIDPIFSDFTRQGGVSPGCAVGVFRAGAIVFSRGYGYADLEHDAPITDATPFYTASLSKQFTAAAVLLLVADGKVSLGDDVRKYIPELPDFGSRITLDQLLHHTSGLRDYHLLLQLEGLNEEDVITSHEILWLLSHQRALNFRPGSYFSYTSSGYVLLAEIVARVSGESFHTFLTNRVLEPLGMESSLVREDHARPIPHRAIGYTLGPDRQPRMLMGNLEYDGSSNFVTTTRDGPRRRGDPRSERTRVDSGAKSWRTTSSSGSRAGTSSRDPSEGRRGEGRSFPSRTTSSRPTTWDGGSSGTPTARSCGWSRRPIARGRSSWFGGDAHSPTRERWLPRRG